MRIPLLISVLTVFVGNAWGDDWERLPVRPVGFVNAVMSNESLVVAQGDGLWKWKRHNSSDWLTVPMDSVQMKSSLSGTRLYDKSNRTHVKYIDFGSDKVNEFRGGGGNSLKIEERDGVFVGWYSYIGCTYCTYYVAVDSGLNSTGGKIRVWKSLHDLAENGDWPSADEKMVVNKGAFFFNGMRSADTGRHWGYFPEANRGISEGNFHDDTIVLVPAGKTRLFRSIDNGANWDTSVVCDSTLISVKFGCKGLHGVFRESQLDGTIHETEAISKDLGRTWITDSSSCPVNSLGSPAPTYKAENGELFRSADSGRSWSPEKTWMFPASISKLSATKYGFLALQWPKLLYWDGGVWNTLRDSVNDFLNHGDTVVILSRGNSSNMARTVNLLTWERITPKLIGNIKLRGGWRGYFVYSDSLSFVESRDAGATWKEKLMSSDELVSCSNYAVSASLNIVCWASGYLGTMMKEWADTGWEYTSFSGVGESSHEYAVDYMSIGQVGPRDHSGVFVLNAGFLSARANDRFGFRGGHGTLARYRDSIIAINDSGIWIVGGGNIVAQDRSKFHGAVRAVWSPVGEFPENGLRAYDSTLVVIDKGGQFWYRKGSAQTGVHSAPVRHAAWTVRGGILEFELPTPSRIRVEMIDLRGRTTEIAPETSMAAGSRKLSLPRSAGMQVLRITVDGKATSRMVVPGI